MLSQVLCFASVLSVPISFLVKTNNAVECSNEIVNINLDFDLDELYDAVEAYAENLLSTNPFGNDGSTTNDVSDDSSSSISLGTVDDTIGPSECDVCSAAGYDFDAGIKIDKDVIERIFDFSGVGSSILSVLPDEIELSVSTSFSSEFCGSQLLCDAISGYNVFNGGDIDSSCQSLNFGFDFWIPTSCNATNDYDPIEVFYKYGYSFLCCDDQDGCNDNYFDNNECDELGGYTSYLNGLVGCWEDVQKDIALYLLCGATDILLNDDDDDSNDNNNNNYGLGDIGQSFGNLYNLTCDEQMLDLLSTFGQCSCTVSDSTGIQGDLVTSLMEFLWSSTCGDIEMTCDNNGDLELNVLYTLINFDMLVLGNFTRKDMLDQLEIIVGLLGGVEIDLVSSSANAFYNETQDTIDGSIITIRTYYTNINFNITTESQDAANDVVQSMNNNNDIGGSFENNVESLWTYTNFTQTLVIEQISDFDINQSLVLINTSDVELSATAQLYSVDWNNQDPWTLASIKSGEAMLILTWISMPLFIAVIAQFSCARKGNMIQFC